MHPRVAERDAGESRGPHGLLTSLAIRRVADGSLEIPAGAVVVQGSRAVSSGFGRDNGLSIYCPVIVKYRDEKTEASTKLEDYLR